MSSTKETSDGAIIRVELGEEIGRRGIWVYRVPVLGLSGRSRQPLLDACRQIERMGGVPPSAEIGLYREGRSSPDLRCRLGVGAGLTVSEPSIGRIKFVPYREGWFPERTEPSEAQAAS